MKEFLEGLFAYDRAVNEKMIAAIMANSSKVDQRTLQLIGHIVSVHQIWNSRMLQTEFAADTWAIPNLITLQDNNNNNTLSSLDIIAKNDLSATFTYKNTSGAEFTNTYTDVLYHIINHSNYHRGQINSRLSQSDIQPVVTDYIAYKRQVVSE